MRYGIFHHLATLGDVLLIKISDQIATHSVTNDRVVALYAGDELVGYNIFRISEVIKIKSNGLIVLPGNALIDVINSLLTASGFTALPYLENSGFVIGEVLTVEEHPESDHLHLTTVNVGNEVLDIVCGAANVRAGQKVVVATIGTMMFDGTSIVPSKLLGYPSSGMICSAFELHLDPEHKLKGILVLEDDAVVGTDFFKVRKK